MRSAVLLLLAATFASAWTESVEFPWATLPRAFWERELAWLKNIGITHISLPQAKDPAQLDEIIRLIRRLNLEADLEGPVPESLRSLTRAHGGPLTDPPAALTRLSALAPDALTRSRSLLLAGKSAFLWTDVEDSLGPAGYRPGALSFTGEERPAAVTLRRSAQLTRYWGAVLGSLHESPGAGTRLPAPGIVVRQFLSPQGASLVAVVNTTAHTWTGDIRAGYEPLHRAIALPNITVPAHDSLWLPVNVPLAAGPLCQDCTAFATVDHLVYATAELTAMEYENGIIAMEFAAPAAGEVLLQLTREPEGPFIAGGKPNEIIWDEKAQRVRLAIPQGSGPDHHVRIGLAMEAPEATAFFDAARVLIIGETNRLIAQFSSDTIAQRSRLRTSPALATTQDDSKKPLELIYNIKIPDTAIHGDHAELSIEADGSRLSHARPQLMQPVTLRFTDAVDLRLAANSAYPLTPAVIPVNQRSGRDIAISVRNNAPAIRTFQFALQGAGLEFSPPSVNVTVGALAARDISFRVFASNSTPGLHTAEVHITGATEAVEPIRFAVIPQNGSVTYTADGFVILESAKQRATFHSGRWLEYINKDNGHHSLPPGGVAFTGSPENARFPDLEQLLQGHRRQ